MIKALRALGWLKTGTNVTRYTDPGQPNKAQVSLDVITWDGTLAVHVNSEGAIYIGNGALEGQKDVDLPVVPVDKLVDLETVRALVKDGTTTWVKGLRVFSRGCSLVSDKKKKDPLASLGPSELDETPPNKKRKPRFKYG